MNKPPPIWFMYVGSGPGYGEKHRIIQDGREIITWSDVAKPGEGYSWMGPREQFSKNFKAIGPDGKPKPVIMA